MHAAALIRSLRCSTRTLLLPPLSLQRLLYVIEKRPCGLVVEALLAHERPAVTTDDATLKAASVVSFTCPIHRLLHAWNVRRSWGALPGWRVASRGCQGRQACLGRRGGGWLLRAAIGVALRWHAQLPRPPR